MSLANAFDRVVNECGCALPTPALCRQLASYARSLNDFTAGPHPCVDALQGRAIPSASQHEGVPLDVDDARQNDLVGELLALFPSKTPSRSCFSICNASSHLSSSDTLDGALSPETCSESEDEREDRSEFSAFRGIEPAMMFHLE